MADQSEREIIVLLVAGDGLLVQQEVAFQLRTLTARSLISITGTPD